MDFISRGIAPKYVPSSSIAALNQKAIRWGYIERNFLKYHDPTKTVREDVFIRKGDIVINSTGDITIGRAYYFKKQWHNLFADSHVTIIRFNRSILLPEFCIYLFPTPEYQSKIYGLVTGATGQLELSKNNLRKLEVVVPPLPIQRKIASILSAYDDLVENNTRRIKILEEMAKTIYDEWFVKFRYPGHEKVKMVESELGMIPEGWEVKKLSEVVEFWKGKKAKNIYEKSNDKTIPYLLIEGLKERKFLYTDDINRIWAKKDNIIMVMDGASSGQVFIGFTGFVGSTLGAFKIKDDLLSPYSLYFFLKGRFKEISDKNVGAAIPHANKDYILSMRTVIPSPQIDKSFNSISCDIFNQIENLQSKIKNLKKTRDLLLPKLISGEIDVENLDIKTEESWD